MENNNNRSSQPAGLAPGSIASTLAAARAENQEPVSLIDRAATIPVRSSSSAVINYKNSVGSGGDTYQIKLLERFKR